MDACLDFMDGGFGAWGTGIRPLVGVLALDRVEGYINYM